MNCHQYKSRYWYLFRRSYKIAFHNKYFEYQLVMEPTLSLSSAPGFISKFGGSVVVVVAKKIEINKL